MVGLGARRGVAEAAVRAALDVLWERLAGLAALAADARAPWPGRVVFVSVERKAREPGILAAIAPAPLVVVPAAELAMVDVPHPSARVAAAAGTPSVAEAAALAVAARHGPRPRLLVPKLIGDGVTVAAAHAGDLR